MEAHSVDLWRMSLHPGVDRLRDLWKCLDRDERTRAFRFRFPRDRDRFVASRGTLRHILAHRLGLAPERLRFGQGPAGKPFLPDHADLWFNVSHAGELLLIGLAHHGPLGVDVEVVQEDAVVDATGPLVLSQPERDELSRLEGPARRERFARFWTRKEAYIKADGRGMSLELGRIDVSGGGDRALLRDPSSGRWTPCERWTLRSLDAWPGYAAAVAAEGDGWRLVRHGWSEGPGSDSRSGSTQPNRASTDISRSLV
jgi:4'-phosphopantetheinyl transferase